MAQICGQIKPAGRECIINVLPGHNTVALSIKPHTLFDTTPESSESLESDTAYIRVNQLRGKRAEKMRGSSATENAKASEAAGQLARVEVQTHV